MRTATVIRSFWRDWCEHIHQKFSVSIFNASAGNDFWTSTRPSPLVAPGQDNECSSVAFAPQKLLRIKKTMTHLAGAVTIIILLLQDSTNAFQIPTWRCQRSFGIVCNYKSMEEDLGKKIYPNIILGVKSEYQLNTFHLLLLITYCFRTCTGMRR